MSDPVLPLALAPDAVAAVVRATHGLHVDAVQALGGEFAANARVRVGDATRMCKIFATTLAGADALVAQARWRRDVADRLHDAGLPVDRATPATDGGPIGLQLDPAADRAYVVLVTSWLPGRPWSEVDLGAESAGRLRRELGAVAARSVEALRGMPRPPVPNDHAWAFETMPAVLRANLAATRERLDDRDAAAVDALLRRFEAVAARIPSLPHGVVHHDLHDQNVLVDVGDDGPRISGVIDFDDARWAPTVAEPAIAAAYAMLGTADPWAAQDDVFGGAERERPLSRDERVVGRAGAALRLCLNAVVWTARTDGATDGYGVRRMARTWPTVRALAER